MYSGLSQSGNWLATRRCMAWIVVSTSRPPRNLAERSEMVSPVDQPAERLSERLVRESWP